MNLEKSENILQKSFNRAFRGGTAGATAMVLQVGSLMWLRTTMNYQYRHGVSTSVALRTLYSQGGIPRFYKGVVPALFQGPLSRFGDTAANAGVITLLDSYSSTKNLPVFIKTLCASFTAGLWRIFLMPVDTLKTTLQVNGKEGMSLLKGKIQQNGFRVMYFGSLASFSATYVGHFPWFFTYNYLNEKLPEYNRSGQAGSLYKRDDTGRFPQIMLYMPDDISDTLKADWEGKAFGATTAGILSSAGTDNFIQKIKSASNTVGKNINKAPVEMAASLVTNLAKGITGDQINTGDIFGGVSEVDIFGVSEEIIV